MRRHGVRALLALLLIGSADAEVLGVRGSSSQIEFYGVETNTLLLNPMPSPCCGIAVGASARDAAGNRHWLGTFSAADGTRLHAVDASGQTTPLSFDSSERIEAMAYDAPRQELLTLVRRSDADGLRIHRYGAGSGQLIASADVSGTCCQLRSGVSTWSNNLRAFVAAGRSAPDQAVALLVIHHDGLVDAHLSLLAATTTVLAVHPATQVLYGLQTPDESMPTTTLFQIALGAGVATYSAIGAGEADCCFVLAGPAAIANGKLQVYARPLSSTDAALHQFDLGTGAVMVLPTVAPAAALHDDATVPVLVVLFRDGFE